MAMYPGLERLEVLRGRDPAGDPFPILLDAPVRNGQPRESGFHLWEEEEVRRCQVWRVGGMGKGPDVFFLKVFLGHLGRMHRRIVSVQNPGSWSQIWTFSSKNFLEHGQDLYNVGRVDPSAPGNVVLVYGALGVEECHYHLGAARGMDPGFDRPRSANGQPLL